VNLFMVVLAVVSVCAGVTRVVGANERNEAGPFFFWSAFVLLHALMIVYGASR
jgi:hypothetical protein